MRLAPELARVVTCTVHNNLEGLAITVPMASESRPDPCAMNVQPHSPQFLMFEPMLGDSAHPHQLFPTPDMVPPPGKTGTYQA